MQRPLVLLILLAVLCGCSSTWTPESSLDLYLKGKLAAEQGHLPAALANLNAAIEHNPKMGVAYMARGDLYRKEGNYEKAAADFEAVVKIEPYNFNANYELGLMYQYLKKFVQAIAAYEKAVEIRPLDPDANMNLAVTYAQIGQPLRGLPYAQRAVQGREDSPATHLNLGMLYSQIGYHSAAIDALKRSIELNSKQPEAYVSLGQEYIADEKFDQARNVLETARTLAPAPLVSERLGVVFYKLRDFDQAAECFNDALKQNPRYFQAYNGLGVLSVARSLMKSPADVELAKEGIGFWKQSLAINSDQPKIQELVNKYTPAQ